MFHGPVGKAIKFQFQWWSSFPFMCQILAPKSSRYLSARSSSLPSESWCNFLNQRRSSFSPSRQPFLLEHLHRRFLMQRSLPAPKKNRKKVSWNLPDFGSGRDPAIILTTFPYQAVPGYFLPGPTITVEAVVCSMKD